MSAVADTIQEVPSLTRTARGLRCRRAKDRPAGPKTQARATNRFYTFAPAGGEGTCDRPAARPATRGDRSGELEASMYEDRHPTVMPNDRKRRSGRGVPAALKDRTVARAPALIGSPDTGPNPHDPSPRGRHRVPGAAARGVERAPRHPLPRVRGWHRPRRGGSRGTRAGTRPCRRSPGRCSGRAAGSRFWPRIGFPPTPSRPMSPIARARFAMPITIVEPWLCSVTSRP